MKKTCLNCGEVFTMSHQIIFHECEDYVVECEEKESEDNA
jgi:predicted  nucleic acid-binding Zn-ribbon protein